MIGVDNLASVYIISQFEESVHKSNFLNLYETVEISGLRGIPLLYIFLTTIVPYTSCQLDIPTLR